MIHELKIWPEFVEPLNAGLKPYEIRYDDRNYKVGDTIVFKEYNHRLKKYTGRIGTGKIIYMFSIPFILDENYVILTIKLQTLIK